MQIRNEYMHATPRGLEICTIIGFTVLYYQFRTVLLTVKKENEAFVTKEYLFK